MKRILIDTDVILDSLIDRKPFSGNQKGIISPYESTMDSLVHTSASCESTIESMDRASAWCESRFESLE